MSSSSSTAPIRNRLPSASTTGPPATSPGGMSASSTISRGIVADTVPDDEVGEDWFLVSFSGAQSDENVTPTAVGSDDADDEDAVGAARRRDVGVRNTPGGVEGGVAPVVGGGGGCLEEDENGVDERVGDMEEWMIVPLLPVERTRPRATFGGWLASRAGELSLRFNGDEHPADFIVEFVWLLLQSVSSSSR